MNRFGKKISVAMTTYNGEKYVAQQLESIWGQSVKPDEVIICDDNSLDSTTDIIKAFIKSHHLSNWLLYCNKPNLGWKKNFYHAIELTTGDVIFFSDQDDVWYEDKIEKMTELMCLHNMDCLYAEKVIIDSSGAKLPERMEKTTFSGKLFQVKLRKSFYDLKTLGCCMCINRFLADLYLRIQYPDGGHDSQCGRLAVLFGSLWHWDAPVINYRVHTNNTSGISEKGTYGRSSKSVREQNIEITLDWLKIIEKQNELSDNLRDLVNQCICVLQRRKEYYQGMRTMFSLIPYYSFYTGLPMFIGDFAYKHHINIFAGKLMWRIKRVL